MLSESTFNVMDSFDEILDHLRGAHGAPLTDTRSFFIAAALLTLATELAGVWELVEAFAEDVANLQFTDVDDSEGCDGECLRNRVRDSR